MLSWRRLHTHRPLRNQKTEFVNFLCGSLCQIVLEVSAGVSFIVIYAVLEKVAIAILVVDFQNLLLILTAGRCSADSLNASVFSSRCIIQLAARAYILVNILDGTYNFLFLAVEYLQSITGSEILAVARLRINVTGVSCRICAQEFAGMTGHLVAAQIHGEQLAACTGAGSSAATSKIISARATAILTFLKFRICFISVPP